MIDTPVRIQFLKRLHLFLGLSEAELQYVADELQEKSFDENGTVFTEGSVADALYFVYQGEVDILFGRGKKLEKAASLGKWEYFGEEGLLSGRKRLVTVNAERGAVLLALTRASLNRILKKMPGLVHNFEIMMSSRDLADEVRFDWLAKNEMVYFLSRKHSFTLVLRFLLPLLLLIPVAALMVFAYLWLSAVLGLVSGFLLICDLAWAAWQYMDWSNDYYIITNQRVVWLEKVIGFYDSRNEASMTTILSVNTEIPYLGQIFGFGSLIVRTYTGQIRMDYIQHPRQAAVIIEEFINRAKERGRQMDEEGMKDAIREKLGLKKAVPVAEAPAAAATPPPMRIPQPGAASGSWWQNMFKMRTEDGNVITYHKHIYGFFRDAGLYALGVILLSLVIILWAYYFSAPPPLWLGGGIMGVIVILFGFIAYQYLDWLNDIYQVTPEQIIDVYKKPFGTEDRKSAPLENILSTEYKRTGILGILLNFGTVYIMVGNSKFDFEDVADPPSVQLDIVRRQQGRMQRKKELEIASERERMTEWLAMYHRTMDDIDRENGVEAKTE